MKNKQIYRIISVVSLLVMALAILSIVYMLFLYQKSSREYQALAEEARAAAERMAEQMAEEAQQSGQAEPEQDDRVPIPVDFEYLLSQNQDIIGWIVVDGTAIDYPVLYDNTQFRVYLNHNYLHAYSPYGSVFMLGENDPDFTDFNTVIYGHNLIDGSMFATLHNFEEQAFFDEHRTIMVYTPDRVLTYEIFAAYRTDNLNVVLKYPSTTREERQAYIDHIYSHEVKAIFDRSIEVTPDDRIITLSTCIANPAYRYLVQGVLVSDQAGISTATAVG
ncbi:MAG: class B sortase [Oscillospiraceae bacterium]|nr:class B sortase [Oscillospiraceae bacterium]